jgi:hypothetical protein
MRHHRTLALQRRTSVAGGSGIVDADAALEANRATCWRAPTHAQDIQPGDLVLISRSGKEAGFVGSARVLSEAAVYDLSTLADPHEKSGLLPASSGYSVPVALRNAREVVSEAAPRPHTGARHGFAQGCPKHDRALSMAARESAGDDQGSRA